MTGAKVDLWGRDLAKCDMARHRLRQSIIDRHLDHFGGGKFGYTAEASASETKIVIPSISVRNELESLKLKINRNHGN